MDMSIRNAYKGILKGTGYFIMYAVLMMLFQAIFSVIFMAFKAMQGIRNEEILISFVNENLLSCNILSIISIGLVFFLVYKYKKKPLAQSWKLYPFKLSTALIASICTLTYTCVFIIVKNKLGINEPDVINNSANYYSEIFPGLGLFMLCINLLIAAPIVEEIVLRGVVFNQIDSTTNTLTAIIGSALLFGIMHIMAGGITLAIGAFLIGLIFGIIYARTKNLWVCIIAHAVANLPDIYLYLF